MKFKDTAFKTHFSSCIYKAKTVSEMKETILLCLLLLSLSSLMGKLQFARALQNFNTTMQNKTCRNDKIISVENLGYILAHLQPNYMQASGVRPPGVCRPSVVNIFKRLL